MKRWLKDYWLEILLLKIVIAGSAWYLYFAEKESVVAIGIILLLVIAVIFSQWEKMQIGSEEMIVSGLELIIAGAFAVIVNSLAIIGYLAYMATAHRGFDFFTAKIAADVLGSNCLILLILFIIPEILISVFSQKTPGELDFQYPEYGFPCPD
jgi:hypothetical protein